MNVLTKEYGYHSDELTYVNGVMGVPITFLAQYSPEQFDIIGRTGDLVWSETECDFFTPPQQNQCMKYKQQNKTWRVQNGYLVDDTGKAHTVYGRLFVKRHN